MKKIKLLLAAVLSVMAWGGAQAQSWTGSEPAEGTFFLYNVGAGKFINVGDKSPGWGTNAYLTAEYGLDFIFEANDNAYNLNSQVSNGGTNYYLATALWCDGAATPWTFTKVDRTDINAYTISNGNSYIVANAAGTDIEYVALSGTERDQWQIIGSTDILANLQANTAAGVKRTIATFFISDPDFGRNDLRMSNNKKVWQYTYTEGGNVTIPGRDLNLGGTGNVQNYGCEFWNNTFDIHQDLTNLPNGIYEFEIYGYGTNGTTYIYATTADGTTEKVFKNQTGAANFQTGLNNIDNYSGNVTGLVQVTDGTLTIGVKRETNSSSDWTVIDQARLYYYGDYTFAEAYGADLKDLIASAQALVAVAPTFLSTTALESAISTAQGVMSTGTTEAEFSTATADLQSAIDTYNAQLTLVSRYADIRTAALAIASGLDVTVADAAAVAATTSDEIDAAIATLRAAFLAELPSVTVPEGGLDVTAVMVDNASVRQNTNYWTIANLSSTGGSAGVCSYDECEFYNRNFKFYQTLALTSGTWEFGVTGFHREGNHSTYFFAGEDKILIPGVEKSVVDNMAGAKTYFDKGNGKVALKFLVETAGNIEIGIDNQDTETDKWTIFRDFTLKYFGAPDYSIYEQQWTDAVTAAETALATYAEFDDFAAPEKTDLTTAKEDAPTPAGLKAGYIAKIQALTGATAAYVAVAKKYESAKAAIAQANAIKEAHNFASADAITTFTNAIKAISDKYDDKSLTQEEAADAGKTLGVSVSGVRANPNGAAVNYMENGFGLTDFEANLYINTWSVEGETDGSDFKVPFYEYWVSDNNSLGEKIWTGTLTDLPNGEYKVSALIRVRAKNGTAAADADGISIDVNGGAAVDVTEGTQIGESQFTMATFEAVGLVKDGTLKFNVNVAAGNNISWLSFKDVKYTKERDLTPEEAAVAPTAIALYNGETEVTEPVALDATTATVTLTPNYTPDHATEGYIEWATSDASVATVADGVVTAVSSGTATITATSTLAPAVSATATVTVSFPETAVAAEDVVLSGPEKSTVTYGANLIKNGTFQYPNPFQGWKSGANGNCDASNYNIVTDGDNKYIQAKSSMGAGDSHSISTGWPIEAGKTYVFGYKVKADAAGNSGYHVVSMTNEIGTETAKVSVDGTPVTTSWTDVKYKFTNSENYAYLQFRARWLANNTSFDDFYLVEVTSEETVGNVQYALDAIPAANVGTGAFQYSQAAIDAANALVQGTATVADVQAAYDALQVVNAPADGQLFHVVLTYDGWTYDNKAMTYIAGGRTDGGNYNIQYKEAANANLAQAFTFTKVEGNNYKMSQIDAEGNVRYLCTGVPYSGNTSQIRTTTNVDDALVVTVIPTATDGKWNLRNTEANQYIGSQDAGVYTVNSHIDFKLVETTKATVAVNTTEAGWGTVMVPFAVNALPSDVKAYTCAAVEGTTLTLTEADALEANKPYIIEGAWNETLTGDAQGIQTTYTEGLLTGVYTETAAPNGSYILQNQKGKGVAFYLVDTSVATPSVKANHAFLSYGGGEVKAFYLGEVATAIEKVMAGAAAGEIFDLAGRKVSRMVKGNAYIVGGRKVVIK